MKTHHFKSLIFAFFLVACNSIAAPTATPTQPKPTSTPTATYTPSPTPTQTPIPTPIGGSEPRVAFIGKDSQGNYGIYVDGFYTRKPEKIASVSASKDYDGPNPTSMKWSSDGKKLIFVNGEPTKLSFFLFDAITGEVQEIAKVPNRQDVFYLLWSQDGKEIFFGTASRSNPQARDWKLGLSDGKLVETKYIGINSSFHVNSSINCDFSSLPSSIKSLFHYRDFVICFYPDMNAYYALSKNEKSTDLVLLSLTGEIGDILANFPVDFTTNGFIGLLLSPDKSQILIVGDGGIWPNGGGHQFAYVAQFDSLPLDKSDSQLFDESTSYQQFVHVYGWSPDGQNYIVASGLWTDFKLAIIHGASGRVSYEYQIPDEIEPAIFITQGGGGIEMTWPSEP